MTNVQIASTVEVLTGGPGFMPFAKVTHCSALGCVTLVAQELYSVNFPQLTAAGFEILDPHHYVLCECGEWMGYGRFECEHCEAEHADWVDDAGMYYDLAAGY